MKSLAKALDVFCIFNGAADDLGVKDICERTGLSKSQVSKILQVFRGCGLLQQDPVTRRYSVGQRAFSIGSMFVNNHPLAHVSLPILRLFVEQSGHSATLSIMGFGEFVHLLAVEGPPFLDARWRVGRTITYHVAASARVLLAFRDPAEIEAMIDTRGLPRFTKRTITDPDEFIAHLTTIRQRGFDNSRSESVVGLGALAVPVVGPDQQVVASLGMLFPEYLIAPEDEVHHVAQLHEAARQISVRMGATIYPYGSNGQARKTLVDSDRL